MADAWRALGGKRRTLARQTYARDRALGIPCPKCKQWVDHTLQWPDPMSRSVDHIDELQDGGSLTDLDNLVTVHLSCNSSKGAARRWERTREARQAMSTIAIDPSTL